MRSIFTRITAVTVAICLLFSGCNFVGLLGSDKVVPEEIAEDTGGDSENLPDISEPVTYKDLPEDLDELTEELLSLTNNYNSYSYPLDENFYLWFYGRYGEKTYRKLALGLANGEETDFYMRLTGTSLHVLYLYFAAETGINQEILDNVYIKEATGSTDIVLDFVGDINLSEDWPNMAYLKSQGLSLSECMSENLVNELKSADILMANNEFCFTESDDAIAGKAYTFKSNPENVELLKEIGVDIVSLANNHSYDFKADGLMDTIKTLDEANIVHVGAGENLDEACKIVYYVINGKKIAITSATQVERTYNYTKEATADSPGVLKTLKADKYVKVIEEAKQKADYVVAYVHWGTENRDYFEADQVALANKFAIAGADVIIGGHTHCLQGWSYSGMIPVIYSMGNFWFDWTTEKSSRTCVVQVIIHEDLSADYRYLPCYYDEYKTTLLTGAYFEKGVLRINKLSQGATVDKDGYVTKD